MTIAKPRFFKTRSEFAEWLAKHHASATELLVGIRKAGSGKPSMTYREALDEALAIGWIDGVRKSLGSEGYTIRFSPRKPRSIWSNVNIKRVAELEAAGRMHPEGRAVFEQRDEKRTGVYSYERERAAFGPTEMKSFGANKKAKEFFERQAPWYQRTATFWVMSAKKEETRVRRLATLIEYSTNGERVPPLAPTIKTR